jgi:23S rRNA (uracil1939-C5)-methyltransferase
MAAAEIFTARVEGIAAGGAGLARLEGKPVFIRMSAPGDRIRAIIKADHGSWAQAELETILEPSPLRTEPPCPHYGICGGCSLQHLNYHAQLEAKTAILRDAFIRIGGFKPPEAGVHPSEPWSYRNRIQLHRVKQAGKAPAGLKARSSGDIVPVTCCPVADPLIQRALREKTLLPPPGKDRFTVYARGNILLSEGGRRRGRIRVRDRELSLDAGVFFQSNGSLLESLVGELLEIAETADPRLPAADLYCGVGTFAAFLGDRFPRIDLLEENRTALALAGENVRAGGGAGKVELFAQTDEAWVKPGRAAGKRRNYGFAVVDPPRQGLPVSMRRWLAEAGPPLLVYVSCDPATLARDSALLLGGGYRPDRLSFYDFYPQTAHIESLVLFRKN